MGEEQSCQQSSCQTPSLPRALLEGFKVLKNNNLEFEPVSFLLEAESVLLGEISPDEEPSSDSASLATGTNCTAPGYELSLGRAHTGLPTSLLLLLLFPPQTRTLILCPQHLSCSQSCLSAVQRLLVTVPSPQPVPASDGFAHQLRIVCLHSGIHSASSLLPSARHRRRRL